MLKAERTIHCLGCLLQLPLSGNYKRKVEAPFFFPFYASKKKINFAFSSEK